MLASRYIQVSKELPRYLIYRQKSRLRKAIEDISEIKQLLEEQMRSYDETTAYQLHRMLTEKGYSISLRTIL